MEEKDYFFITKTNEIIEALEKEGLYTISVLEKRLRQEGFANTKVSIYSLEDSGKILPCTERRLIRGKMWRLYTQERIDEIIKQLKTLPQKRVLV